jgi:hypothetical protein
MSQKISMLLQYQKSCICNKLLLAPYLNVFILIFRVTKIKSLLLPVYIVLFLLSYTCPKK